MKILTSWLRELLPTIPTDDRQLAEDLTLRGIAVEGEYVLPDGGGTLYEMDITTNRVDAMNHYGVAREAAAMYGLALQPLEQELAAPVAEQAPGEPWPVRIEAEDLCGHFTARLIRGVRVGASHGAVAQRFQALGQKPISAPVDATNYGWLLMGQPTHAFDADKIEGAIVVRRARAGERLRLLDGTERTLVPDDLVVADDVKALGLAGVMGGWESRVTDETRNILVEAAWFLPAAVRASSRRHGLHTDASHRFERGADFAAAPVANNLVTRLIVQQCGGTVTGPMTQVTVPSLAQITAKRPPVLLRVARVPHLLGTTLETRQNSRTGEPPTPLDAGFIRRTLEALGCTVEGFAMEDVGMLEGSPSGFQFALPSWRLDLEREIDLIEEVARVYGYNGFADTLPRAARAVDELPHARAEHHLRSTLRAAGYSEALSSTFVSDAEATLYGAPGAGSVRVGNPLSEEAAMLRPSLVASTVRALAENTHRDVPRARIFELGTIFTGSQQTVDEAPSLAVGVMDSAPRASSLYAASDALFFELKGVVEALLAAFEGNVTFAAAPLPSCYAAGRGAIVRLNGRVVGRLGEVNDAERSRLKLRVPVAVAELDAGALLSLPLRQSIARDVSRFQAVERDWSFLVPDSVTWDAVEHAVSALQIAELEALTPVEIFRDAKGKAVPVGEYSLLLRARFQAADRTLTDAEIAGWSERIVAAIASLGAKQRA